MNGEIVYTAIGLESAYKVSIKGRRARNNTPCDVLVVEQVTDAPACDAQKCCST